jgi:hypothetical protein
MTTAFERVVDALRNAGRNVILKGGDSAQAQCPAHDDHNPSLTLRTGEGRVLVYCHAGCQTEDVMAALNMTMGDLFDDREGRDYIYPGGRQSHRRYGKDGKKKFWQDGDKTDNSLYGSDRITPDTKIVLAVEGEQDVDTAASIGLVAVSSPMGAGKARKADWSPCHGHPVMVITDKDDVGRRHAGDIVEILNGNVPSIGVFEAADGCHDLTEHVAAGHGIGELVRVSTNGQHPAGAETEPQIDGAELLDDVMTFLSRFVVYPTHHARVAHALWVAHTWLMSCWESTPRIAFLSPEPGSGKSRALEVTEPLVPRPVHAVNTTSAYLFRKVADPGGKPTILYDEIDTVFGPKAKENEDIRGMLNAGHRKGAKAGRCVVKGKAIETEELDAYCAVMLAGLDDLPDTLMSRSIVIRMQRRAPTEPVEPWRPRVNEPEAHALRARIEAWAGSVNDAAADLWPEMPAGVEDRFADKWEALITVADLAGGHWPETARVAAVTDVTDSMQAHPHSIGVQLLQDIKIIFEQRDVKEKAQVERIFTENVLTDLKGMEEAPWATIRRGEPINARSLAQRLGKYGIEPDLQRIGEETGRGYTRAQFADAWSRYLPTESVTSVTSDTDGEEDGQAPTLEFPSMESVTSVTSDTDTDDDAAPAHKSGEDRGWGTRDPRWPTGAGRCIECGFHIVTQGHRTGCPWS